MRDKFNKHITHTFPFLKESKVLVAVSGGIDSVVLTHLCTTLGLNISLAHCNFNLRGKESDADEDFVIEFADELELEVFIQNFDTQDYARSHSLSLQMAARQLRYSWFDELSNQLNFDSILTAHHADDNLETFLINLSRGTGLEGLTGIPEINGKVIRPLLPFSRQEIENYAKNQGLQWREDSSNVSEKYLRNKIRHQVIPTLKEINPKFLQNFLTTQKYLEKSKKLLDQTVNEVFTKVAKQVSANEIHYSISELKKLQPIETYMFELFKAYQFTAWNDIVELLDAQTGKYITSKTHRLLKNRTHLILTSLKSSDDTEIPIRVNTQEVETPAGLLQIEKVEKIEKTSTNSIYVDKDLLKFPITVRLWQNGDYFYPFGMQGKKKLSKFFKDEKYSIVDKENAYVLSSENSIVWVLNKRPDDRFKVTDKTKNILKITLCP
ncbi:MAG TPA: tRNA lysidine(34) synthetase TilS [Flavobacteriaceae bacterium]|nr:tRNA lysidine(34) synthetase TilS [Flavobacteriaceae bacterium]